MALFGLVGTSSDLKCNIHPSMINTTLSAVMQCTGYCHSIEVRPIDDVPSPLPTMAKAIDAARLIGMGGIVIGRSLKEKILPELDQLDQVSSTFDRTMTPITLFEKYGTTRAASPSHA